MTSPVRRVLASALCILVALNPLSAAFAASSVIVAEEFLVRKEGGISTPALLAALSNKAGTTVTLIEDLASEQLLRVRLARSTIPASDLDRAKAIKDKSFALSSLSEVNALEPVVQFRMLDAATDRTLATVGSAQIAKRVGLQALVGAPLPSPRRQIIVAVIDTGFSLDHEIFKGLLLPGIDVTVDGQADAAAGDPARARVLSDGTIEQHGTGTAGMVALMIRGGRIDGPPMADVKILPIRAATSTAGDQRITSPEAIKAISAALAQKAAVISISWGDDGESSDLKRKFTEAVAANVLIVTAAGNGKQAGDSGPFIGFDIDRTTSRIFPASWQFPTQVSVAALDSGEKLARFSNWGPSSVKLAAPGEELMCPTVIAGVPGSIYTASSGTSYSAPIVAGIAAIYLSTRPKTNAQQVARLLGFAVEKDPSFAKRIVSSGRLSGLKLASAAVDTNFAEAASPATGVQTGANQDAFQLASIERWLRPVAPQLQAVGGSVLKGVDANGDATHTENVKSFLVRLGTGHSIEKAMDGLSLLSARVKSSRRVDKDLYAVEIDAPSGTAAAKAALSSLPSVQHVEVTTSFSFFTGTH